MNNPLKIESLKAELRGEFEYSGILNDISVEFEEVLINNDAVKNYWLTVNLDSPKSQMLLSVNA